jgi:hypothetical protein
VAEKSEVLSFGLLVSDGHQISELARVPRFGECGAFPCDWPVVVRAQWSQHRDACLAGSTRGERRFFANLFRRLVAGTQAPRGPLAEESWARPAAQDDIDERALGSLCANLDAAYERGWSGPSAAGT